MAEPLTINVQQAAKAAPAVYTVTNATDIEIMSAFARYDGSAAAAFLPALTFYSSAGLIIARVFPSGRVAAGGTADVTFAAFLGGDSGIVYDSLNVGGFLDVETTAAGPSGSDLLLHDSRAGGEIALTADDGNITVRANGGATRNVDIAASGSMFLSAIQSEVILSATGVLLSALAGATTGITVQLNAAGQLFRVRDDLGNAIFEVRDDGSVHILTATAVIADL